jgi:protein-tyrosine phosphatase
LRKRHRSLLERPRFADLHAHLLPAVDDGPAELAETVEMLRLAHGAGTRRIVATPHMFSPGFQSGDAATLRRVWKRTEQRLQELNERHDQGFLKEIEVFLGSENYVSPEFFQAFEQDAILSLNGSRYLLVEFSPFLEAPVIESALRRILDAGMLPVVAHVERYPALERQIELLTHLVEMGCIFQINAPSLLLRRRSPLRKTAWWLLERGLVQVIASDAHGPDRRSPALDTAFDHLARRFSERQVRDWMWQNPSAILEDRTPQVYNPAGG